MKQKKLVRASVRTKKINRYITIILLTLYILIVMISLEKNNYFLFTVSSAAIILLAFIAEIILNDKEGLLISLLIYYLIFIIVSGLYKNSASLNYILDIQPIIEHSETILFKQILKFVFFMIKITSIGILLEYSVLRKKIFKVLDISISNLIGIGLVSLVLIITGILSEFYYKEISLAGTISLALIVSMIITKKIKLKILINREKIIATIVVLPFILTTAIHIMFFPELYWDSLVYGINYAKILYNEGLFPNLYGGPSLGIEWSANYPPLHQVILSTIFYEIDDISVPIARLFSLTVSIETLIIAYAITKKFFDDNQTYIILSIILIISTPLYILYSRYSIFYITFLSYVTASLYYILDYLREKKIKHMFLSSLFSGFSLLTTYIGFTHLLSTMASIHLLNTKKNLEKKKTKQSLTFLIVSLVVVLPWFFRNFTLLGNPLWPFGGGKYIDKTILNNTNYVQREMSKTFGFDLSHILESIHRFIFLIPNPYNGVYINGLKPSFALFVIPAVACAIKEKSKSIKFLTLYIAFSLLIWVFVLRWFERYLINIVIPSSIISVYFIDKINKFAYHRRFPIIKVIITLFVVYIYSHSFLYSLNWDECHKADKHLDLELLKHLGNYNFILERCYSESYDAWVFINKTINKNERILTNDIRWFYMSHENISDIDSWEFRFLYSKNITISKIISKLCKKGVKYIYLNNLDSSIILPKNIEKIFQYDSATKLLFFSRDNKIRIYKLICTNKGFQ